MAENEWVSLEKLRSEFLIEGEAVKENWKDPEMVRTWLGELEHLNVKLEEMREIMARIIGPEESGQKAQADSICLADEITSQITDAVAQTTILYEQIHRITKKIGQRQ